MWLPGGYEIMRMWLQIDHNAGFGEHLKIVLYIAPSRRPLKLKFVSIRACFLWPNCKVPSQIDFLLKE